MDGYASSKKFAGPHLASAQKHGKRAWLAAKLHLNGLLVHPRVRSLALACQLHVQESPSNKKYQFNICITRISSLHFQPSSHYWALPQARLY